MNTLPRQTLLSALFRMIFVLLAVSVLTFILVTSSPIDPVAAYVGGDKGISKEQREEITKHWGLDKSPVQRYFIWGKNVLHGDMGESLIYRQPVIKVMGDRFLASLALMGIAWLFSGMLGFAVGIICAVSRSSLLDRTLKGICLLLSSTPTFWLGLVILMIFSHKLKWFPMGLATPIGVLEDDVTIGQRIHHLILPALTLSLAGISNIAMHTRSKLIHIWQSDYVLFAVARGESKGQIIWRHGLRGIALPAITLQFASFSELFGGSVLAEQVFSYPGLGNAAVAAGTRGDMPLLIGIALFTALFVFIGNLAANMLGILLNPRIREGSHWIIHKGL